MSACQQPKILRTATLRKWVYDVCDSGVMTKEDFANAAIRIYRAIVPADLRDIVFPDPDDGKQVRNNNSIKFWRFFESKDGKPPVRLPANFEEAIVFAMPEPFRSGCLRDLSARYGLLPTQIPTAGEDGAIRDLASVMKEAAEFVSASSTLPTTVEGLQRVKREGEEAMGAIASYLVRLEAELLALHKPALKVAK